MMPSQDDATIAAWSRRGHRRAFCAWGLASLVPMNLCGRSFSQEPNLQIDEGLSAQEALEQLRRRDHLPGLIAGHFTLAGDEELAAAGFRSAATNDALRPDDPMHLGSCTKSMTATLLGILVDQGMVGFETKLGEIFHEDPAVTASPWKNATMRQLMNHTSGAIPNPPWNQFDGPIEQAVSIRREILHWMADTPRRNESVGRFTYSNLGYVILGHAIEQIAGHAWEHEIRKRLFEPLGMKSAGFGPPSRTCENAPRGHGTALGFSVVNDRDNPPALGPAGTVHASMKDWIAYLRVHLMANPSKEVGLPITASTLQQLHQPAEGEPYAGGWMCEERDWAGGRILTHNGSNTHWYCVVFLALQQGRGVIAASNVGPSSFRACDEALQWMIRRHRMPG